ncbi:MlaD family protein [Gordonia sp. HY002]|uniref:MlaD family protein n=1 Tax=Gordonia zhenghanii TaxID=2911516 RepID=UPI001EF0DC03|nr:MlaD family protein [Gordonia zhenghanii]MCF8571687.1 MlaD family protein [Gordonia zhenghanii]MCF8602710.1 MlaD family protein [Gordonia zhenghanii]
MIALRRLGISALVIAMVAGLSGCGSLPGVTDSASSYSLDIEFESVLNVPSGASVLLDGVRVGDLSAVRLEKDVAIATVAIDRGVEIPESAFAALEQETLLGDMYIALSTPPGAAGPYLSAGETITVDRTAPPDNVETVMLRVSQLLNGGLLGRSQDAIAQLNEALPDQPEELSRLAKTATEQLIDIGDSTQQIDHALTSAGGLIGTVSEHRKTVERVLTIGPERFGKMQELFLSLVDLISNLRLVTRPGSNLLNTTTYSDLKTMLATVDPWLMEIARSDRTLGQNALEVRDLLVRKVAPFVRDGGEVDVRRIDHRNVQATRVVDFLRAIGMV